MKVAFIVTTFPALSETFIIDQITGLIDRHHEVDIYASRRGRLDRIHPAVKCYGLMDRACYPRVTGNLFLRYGQGLGLICGRMVRSPRIVLRALHGLGVRQLVACEVLARGLRRLRNRKSYDIIHCHFGPNGVTGAFYREAGLLDGKLITTFHGYDVSTYPRRYGRSCYKPLFEQGDLFTANTKYTAEGMIRLGCPRDRIITLPVGADLARFPFTERSLTPGGEIRVLTVGRLSEGKGTEYGIRAVTKVASDHPGIRYDIVGDGPLRRQLTRLTGMLGIRDRVHFHGAQTQDRVLELYAQAHIFMLPSVIARNGAQEAQGLVLVEAQAAGIPVISTRTGGIPETVLAGESGFLVPQRDANALAAKLRYLIEHPETWPAIGREGRAHVERHFDLAKLNDRLVEIYGCLQTGTMPQLER